MRRVSSSFSLSGLLPLRRVIHDFAADCGQQDLSLADHGRLYLEDVLRHDDEIRQFPGLERPFGFFTAAGERSTQRISFYRIRNAETLLGDEPSRRLAVRGLTCDRGLNAWPGIQCDDRPIASESQLPAIVLNAVPHPWPLGALGTDIARPNT